MASTRLLVSTLLGFSFALGGCQFAEPASDMAGSGAIPAMEPERLPFRALGQEPSWLVIVEDSTMTFVSDFGQSREVLPLLETRYADAETRFVAADASGSLVVSAVRRLCRDTMSGMPHPYTVTASRNGEQFAGCGGAPLDLLTGRTWVIEDLDDAGIVDRSRITIEFLPDDSRVAGRASCNAYNAAYTLSGEGLTFSQIATTKMACAPALMHQEQEFLRILAAVDRFDFDHTDALLLLGREGHMKGYPELSR